MLDSSLPPISGPISQSVDGPLAEEAMVAILLRGRSLARLMCTPRDLDELALGYLLTRGLIRERDELSYLSVCPDRSSVSVDLHGDLPEEARPERFVTSACGSGHEDGDRGALPTLNESLPRSLALGKLREALRAMFARGTLHAKTGGMHSAALLYESGELVVREDVGRHNAVDKALGRALLDGRLREGRALLTSGRIAFDMVFKAAMAGVAIIVSRSIPTSAAYELAIDAGLTIVGRGLSPNPIVYARPDRLA